MTKSHNHIGKRFNMLTVLSREPNDKNNKTMWLCKCDCGNEKIMRGQELIRKESTSCGCIASMLSRVKKFYSLVDSGLEKEDENFKFTHLVCCEKRRNMIVTCKKCEWKKSFCTGRVYGLEKHCC